MIDFIQTNNSDHKVRIVGFITILFVIVFFGGLFIIRLLNYFGVFGTSTHTLSLTRQQHIVRFSKPEYVAQVRDVNNKHSIRLLNDAVPLELTLPISFERADFVFSFRPNRQKSIFLSARATPGLPDDSLLIYSELLEDLDWPAIHNDDGLTLYQREPTYSSLESFFQNPPSPQEVGLIGTDGTDAYRMPYTTFHNQETDFGHTLRGSHTYETYVQKDESFVLRTSIIDLNEDAGVDEVSIIIGDGENIFEKRFIVDDGNILSNKKWTERPVEISISGMPAGVYRVSLGASSDDILFSDIRVRQPYMSFLKSVHFADAENPHFTGVKIPVTVITDSSEFFVQVADEEYSQDTHLDGFLESRRLSPGSPISLRGQIGENTIRAGLAEMEFSGDGYFTTPEMYFRPVIGINIDSLGSIDPESPIRYIVAHYDKPNVDNGVYTAIATFDLRRLFVDDHTFFFSIDAPHMYDRRTYIEPVKLDIVLKREPITLNKLFTKLRQ